MLKEYAPLEHVEKRIHSRRNGQHHVRKRTKSARIRASREYDMVVHCLHSHGFFPLVATARHRGLAGWSFGYDHRLASQRYRLQSMQTTPD